MTSKLRIPLLLMVMTILVISLFQLYWLRKNYREEKHLFSVRTNLLFRETIMRLQASKLHLDSNINIRVQDKEGIVSMTNILQDRIKDSSRQPKNFRTAMVITVKSSGESDQRHDSNMQYQFRRSQPGGPVFDFLMGVDSLRDSITLKEVTDRYQQALAKQKIAVPFAISVTDTAAAATTALPDMEGNRVSVGFMKPRIYQLDFINSNWYVLKQMWQPVLVSLLLVGVTIASFLLLYRNLIRQQKLTQLKNDFISNITHELKTPIATVSVAIEALKNFNALQDPARTKEYLDISANEMQRLGLLVDKVLKLSLYENKEIALQKEPFDLDALAHEVVASMKLQFEKQHAEVEIITTGSNFTLEADRLHMTSVLYNLLDNALKYSREDPRIVIHITDHEQFLALTVTDNGVGIAPEYRQKVFEQFFRVPDGDRHNTKGYGLGLSYVHHIVQRHMGFIEVESTPGKGSSFSVKLPFKEAAVIHYDNGRVARKMVFKIGKE
jgi:two-component system, OmpR family, phosphate regulon sensor histidine kinase PhoR